MAQLFSGFVHVEISVTVGKFNQFETLQITKLKNTIFDNCIYGNEK